MGNNISCLTLSGISLSLPSDYDILEVKSQRDDFLQYREELERQVEFFKAKLTEHLKNDDKKNAKYAYCNKKINEELLALVDSSILEILNLLSEIEHKRLYRNVIGTITNGVDTIKKINYAIACQWAINDDYKAITMLINEMPELFSDLRNYIESDNLDAEELDTPTPIKFDHSGINTD